MAMKSSDHPNMCSVKTPEINAPPPPPPPPPPPAETASLDVNKKKTSDGVEKKRSGRASLRIQRSTSVPGGGSGLNIPKG